MQIAPWVVTALSLVFALWKQYNASRAWNRQERAYAEQLKSKDEQLKAQRCHIEVLQSVQSPAMQEIAKAFKDQLKDQAVEQKRLKTEIHARDAEVMDLTSHGDKVAAAGKNAYMTAMYLVFLSQAKDFVQDRQRSVSLGIAVLIKVSSNPKALELMREATGLLDDLRRCWDERTIEYPVGDEILATSPNSEDIRLTEDDLLLGEHVQYWLQQVADLYRKERPGDCPSGPDEQS